MRVIVRVPTVRMTMLMRVSGHSTAMDGSARLVKRWRRALAGYTGLVRAQLFLVASPLLAFAIAAGCSSSNPSSEDQTDAGPDAAIADAAGPTCVNVLPPACPSPAPSYETDVLPILEQRCYACHADAGITTSGSGIDLGSYAQVYKLRGDVISQVNACRMPPPTAAQPTLTEKTTVLGWLKCNAPDN